MRDKRCAFTVAAKAKNNSREIMNWAFIPWPFYPELLVINGSTDSPKKGKKSNRFHGL